MSASASPSTSTITTTTSSTPTIEWIHSLPKIELHAHLSGSVREETILELMNQQEKKSNTHESEIRTFRFGDRTLSECFDVFRILHRLINSLAVLKRVTKAVIHDFARENTCYLELRTTPRAFASCEGEGGVVSPATNEQQYVDAVCEVIRECADLRISPSGEVTIVRLILSIDRSQSLEAANRTVDLAIAYSKLPDPIVVGVDFSGNPTISSFRAFRDVFQRAKQAGLKCSIHIGERLGDEDDLSCVLYEFHPDRIGHVVCINDEHREFLRKNPIPIEICPTSNLKTQIVKEWKEHPFGDWRKKRGRNDIGDDEDSAASTATTAASNSVTLASVASSAASNTNGSSTVTSTSSSFDPYDHYPLVICTDDSGVFNITLTSEIHNLSQTFDLQKDELWNIERKAVEFTFVGEERKKELREVFRRFSEEGLTNKKMNASIVESTK